MHSCMSPREGSAHSWMIPGKESTHPRRILMMLHDWHFVNKWILCFCSRKEGNVWINSRRYWYGQVSNRLEFVFEPHDPVSNNTSCPWNWTAVA